MSKFFYVGFLCLFFCGCDKPKPAMPASFPESTETEAQRVGTFFELGKYLNQPTPNVFTFGPTNLITGKDFFSEDFLFPGTKVNVHLSDSTEGLERIEPTGDSRCYAKLDFSAEKADDTTYRIFLTKRMREYYLSVVGTRVIWKVTGTPKMTRDEKKQLLKDQPHCAYYANYVGYGIQTAIFVSFEMSPFNRFSSVKEFENISPGQIAESKNMAEVWKVAQEVKRIFVANGASLSGAGATATYGGNMPRVSLMKEDTTAEMAETEMANVLNVTDVGHLTTPIRDEIGFPNEVDGVAVEARITHLLSQVDPHRKSDGVRVRGFGL